MNSRPSNSRKSVTRDPQRNRTRSSESNRGRNCNPIEECDELQMIEEEHECESLEQESRYDPKELRDIVKILSPFVRLIEDTKNPYARIVAREVCKTFYRLFHPNIHPADVIKSINWRSKTLRSLQLWDEFWLYVPGGKINDWVPLVKCPEDDTVINPNESFKVYRPLMTSSPKNTNYNNGGHLIPRSQRQNNLTPQNFNINTFTNHDNNSPNLDASYNISFGNNNAWNLSNECPPELSESLESSEFNENTNYICTMVNNISPSEIMCDHQDHQAAGADSSQYVSSNFLNNKNQNKYTSKLVATHISDDKHLQQKQFAEYVNKKCFVILENTTRQNELLHNDSHGISSKRQIAGNDNVFMPHCEPGPSSDPPHFTDNPSQFEYYRITGNTASTSRQNQESPIEPGLRSNVLDNPQINDEKCSDSDSVESVKGLDMNQIACNASIVANAFTNLTLASNELKKKKEAFKKLTHSYLNVAPNLSELNPSGENNTGAKMVLQTLYENPPKISPFDDHEWNDNAFKDRDFIRLLPFYESVHNELEYISKTQRDYGYNMLDDIMSTLYHIHYDLGDPRLKNELLVEHVKLITANTWEAYFYKGNKKMPAIPERIPSYLRQPSTMQTTTRECSQREPCPREPISRNRGPRVPAPREACPREPPRESRPKPSVHRRPPVQRRAVPSREPASASASAATSNRPQTRTTSCRRMADAPQQNENLPTQTQTQTQTQPTRSFLRRSRPSGAPKAWAPKLKPIERPESFKDFKAKPLPKFVRQRINSDNDGQC